MSFRSCVYKGCQNYIFDRAHGANFSLFKFPKNPERRKKWMDLGQAPDNLPESAYCYCSNHFDRKFLSINRCRTLLVGEAVPYAYTEEESKTVKDDDFIINNNENTSYIVVEEESNEQIDLQVESTTATEEDKFLLNKVYLNNESNGMLDSNQQSNEPQAKKIKVELLHHDYYNLKTQKSVAPSISSTQEFELCDNTSEKKHFEKDGKSELQNCTINNQNITTFIFKGEEYVQMSKEFYLKEKTDLCNQIEKLQRILNKIKEQISTVDF